MSRRRPTRVPRREDRPSASRFALFSRFRVGRLGESFAPWRERARWSSLRGNRLARATAGTLLTAAAGQFFLLMSGPLLARLLGVEDRGHFAWLSAWVGIVVALGHFGTPWACGYYASRHPSQIRQLIGTARLLLAAQSVVLTLVLWLILSMVVADERELSLAIIPTLALVPAALLHIYAISFLQAQQRFLAFNVTRTAPVALFAIVIAGMFVAGQDRLVYLMTAWTLCHAVVAVGAVIALLARLPEEDERQPGQLRRILAYAVRGSIATTSPLDQFPLDQLVVGFFLSPLTLGLWVVASAFRNLPLFIGQSIGMVTFPASAAIAEARASWRLIWRFLGVVTVLMLPITAVLFAAMPYLVHLFFGEQFAEASSIARILVIGAFFAALRQVLLDGLRGTGNPGFATIAELSMYPWLIVATPILLWQFGADGVAVVLAIAFAICFSVALIGALRLTREAGDELPAVPRQRTLRITMPRLGRRLAGVAGIALLALLAGVAVAKVGATLSTGAVAAALVLVSIGVVWVSSPSRIFWLLAAAVATTPFTTIRALGALGNVSDALFMVVLLALLVRASIQPQLGRQLFALGPRALPLVVIAVAGILSSMNAVSSKESLFVLAKIVFTFWMIPNILAVQAQSERGLRILIWAYIVGASIASLGAMSDMLLGTGLEAMANPGEGAHGQGRYAGPTGHPNLLGLVAATGVSGAVGLYLTRARGGSAALIAAAVCAVGIFASASLTAVAAVCGGVAAAFFLAGRRAALRRGTVLVAVFVATMFLFGKVASDGGQVLLLSRLEGDLLGQESVEEREAINEWAIAEVRESPFIGHGLDQVGTGPTHTDALPIIHNLWIQTWYTAGIIGVVGFVLLYFVIWRMRRDVPRLLLVPFAAMTVPWLASMISQTDVYARWGLFGFFGIVAASLLRSPEPAPRPEPAMRPLPHASGAA